MPAKKIVGAVLFGLGATLAIQGQGGLISLIMICGGGYLVYKSGRS